ncbi:hypothetical protein DCE93_05750 [Agromyces badenianii]|uniref:LysM domain-containing protein n=1 Tax=Agromyces badenianii TaxID=2080742 RepID=A0A2S0WV73_9MICO|nr:LysM peptidoglycan-binding domain-containing protein [Agromyces badenianii]AWB95222.1 hypothetical protein DCE93_05750 [Agromyces badenianii]
MSAVIATTGFQAPGVRQEPASAATRTRLRLTRRGRIVFTGLAAVPLVIWAFVVVLGAGTAAADIESSGVSFEYTTVGEGDSLWAIAESIDPNADARDVIDEIMRLNGLDDAVVEPGQRLALPVVP